MADNQTKFLHNVFFTLKDPSAARQQKLVDDCHRYLSKAPGAVSFAAGTRNPSSTRDVNIADFHVALTILFESAAAQSAYQDWGPHKEFIQANSDNWAQVRVFDSDVT